MMIRSSRLAEPQSAVAFDMADPRAWDSIAGTLIEAVAAARESTTRAFWDLVFCRMLTISTTIVNSTAKALTISASATNSCRLIRLKENLSETQESRKFSSFYFLGFFQILLRPSADAIECLLDVLDRVGHAEAQIAFPEIAKGCSR